MILERLDDIINKNKTMNKFILIYSVYKSEVEAKEMVSKLLKEKLIACANLFPINSLYEWNGKMEDAREIVAILKTRKENWDKVRDFVVKVQKGSTYDCPCIIKLAEVEANEDYNSWIHSSTI